MDANDQNDQSSSKGKSTDPIINGGFRPQAAMVVQPPKVEDLQQSYASIVGTDADPKGWYGSMSMSAFYLNSTMRDC
jgi:erythrocyte band 7 integral membrane protein